MGRVLHFSRTTAQAQRRVDEKRPAPGSVPFGGDLLRNPGPRLAGRRPRPVEPIDRATLFAIVGFVSTYALVAAIIWLASL